MDPHSRLSQFNHRVTKAGPLSRPIEHVKPAMATLKKPAASNLAESLLIRRPIATNSRIKQDEIVKRDMYLSFVTNALNQKALGKSDSFDELVAQFSPTSDIEINTAQLRLWINSLSHVVSRLEKTHSALVHSIVNLPWITLDNATVKSYTIFIGSLLSARPEYLSLVLAKIAQNLTYQSAFQALSSQAPCSSTDLPITRRLIYDRLHYLLRHLLALIPTLPSTLQPFIIRNFPHKRQNQVAQTTYIRNILRISTYCPELADRILATIVDRAIQIDVEIQIELEELEEMETQADQEVFELDPFDTIIGQEDHTLSDDEDDGEDGFSDLSSDAGDVGDEDEEKPDVPTNTKHIQEMVKKLDSILLLLFEHLQRTWKSANAGDKTPDERALSPIDLPPLPPLDSSSSITVKSPSTLISTGYKEIEPPRTNEITLRAQFDTLLSIFDRTILRTFKSRYTQFLLFWYASLDPEFADVFQGMLVDRALLGTDSQQNQPPIGSKASQIHARMNIPELTRAAAASYIGSFVSRATFVDREGTRRAVGVLCEYLRLHLEGVEQALKEDWSASGKGYQSAVASIVLAPGQHTVFYAVTQAVFLIFCFRWRDLLLDDAELEMDLSPRVSGGLSSIPTLGMAKDKWIPDLATLKRIVTCVLNPLKVCSANVVMQFARIAQATNFVYCYPILDANKRAETSTYGASDSSASRTAASRPSNASTSQPLSTRTFTPALLGGQPVNAELNTFFPFDPYRLPKSNAFIQGVYREWSSVALDDEDDDEDSSEDEEEDEDDSDRASNGMTGSGYLAIARKQNADDGGLGHSLEAMSISPQRMAMSISTRG